MKHFLNLKYFAMLLLMAMACVSFTACGGDDDDDPIVNPDTPSDPSGGGSETPSKNLDKELIGQWVYQSENGLEKEYILLNADGTGKWWLTHNGEVYERSQYIITSWETPSEGILITKEEDMLTGKETFTEKMAYTIRYDNLTLTYYDDDGVTLTAQKQVFKRMW